MHLLTKLYALKDNPAEGVAGLQAFLKSYRESELLKPYHADIGKALNEGVTGFASWGETNPGADGLTGLVEQADQAVAAMETLDGTLSQGELEALKSALQKVRNKRNYGIWSRTISGSSGSSRPGRLVPRCACSAS